ncbi:MAG: DUF4345 domain-containing protein [Roseovarius sp.]|nr:DUF4345 domain-containing protein [Roseovarius sp.]
MSLTIFQKTTLGIAGTTALLVGGFILAAPHVFYASYGIELGANPNLLSELRAPGTGLAVLGGIMLMGVIRAAWASVSLTIALAVYLAFPAGRLVSLMIDGMPSNSVLGALGIEVAIAILCLRAFRRPRIKRPVVPRFVVPQNRYPT